MKTYIFLFAFLVHSLNALAVFKPITGTISIQQDSINPYKIKATVKVVGSLVVPFLDDKLPIQWDNDSAYYIPLIDTVGVGNNLFILTYEATNIYLPTDTGIKQVNSQMFFRINNIVNVGEQMDYQMYIQSKFNLDVLKQATGYFSPQLSKAIYMLDTLPNSIIYDPQITSSAGDSVYARLTIPMQTEDIQMPFYLYPHQVLDDPDSVFTFNSATGVIVWSKPYQGLYNVALMVEAIQNDTFISSTYIDMVWTIVSPQVSSINNEQDGLSEMMLYPNPTTHTLTINHTLQGELTYTINATNGSHLLQGKTAQATTQIDVSNLAAGLYFITLQNDTQQVVRRWVKE